MLLDDERHGSEAGHEQHCRDLEPPCDPCYQAKILAARRRTKRRTMGHTFRRPLGVRNHTKLSDARRRGHTYESLAGALGLSASVTWRLCTNGAEGVVSARTWLIVATTNLPTPVTQTGTTRRLQALTWLGYSTIVIAERARVHNDTIRDALREPRTLMTTRAMSGIADAYDALSMTLAAPEGQQRRAGATRARNLARSNGWLPPLAWDDIDDPNETPRIGRRRPTKDQVDPVVVIRVLAGDYSGELTMAERAAVVAEFVRVGRPLRELELAGWRPERYVNRTDGAA